MFGGIISVVTIIVLIVLLLYFVTNPSVGVDFAKTVFSIVFDTTRNAFVYVIGAIK
jgi:hypothetical protein